MLCRAPAAPTPSQLLLLLLLMLLMLLMLLLLMLLLLMLLLKYFFYQHKHFFCHFYSNKSGTSSSEPVHGPFIVFLKTTLAKMSGIGKIPNEFIDQHFWASLPSKFRSFKFYGKRKTARKETDEIFREAACSDDDFEPLNKNKDLFNSALAARGITYKIRHQKG